MWTWIFCHHPISCILLQPCACSLVSSYTLNCSLFLLRFSVVTHFCGSATTALSHVQIPSHGTFDPLIVFQCSLSLQLIFWVILAILLNWRKARNWFSGCQSAPPVQMWLPLSINTDLERVLIIAELSSQRICYSLHSTFPEFHTCMVSQTNGWPDLFCSPSSWGAFPTWSFT